jgi:hypothetical protein
MTEIDELSVRLAAVERRATRLGRASGVIGLALGFALALAGTAAYREERLARTAERLQGREVVLRDVAGRVRGVLGIRADGGVALMLADAEAQPRALLAVAREGTPALGLSDGQG